MSLTIKKAPLITDGQLYLNEQLNEYLIVTQNNRGQISYAGHGYTGQANDDNFIARFKPVDPVDVSTAELQELLSLCKPGTVPLTAYISD